jgi:hypothetical protein
MVVAQHHPDDAAAGRVDRRTVRNRGRVVGPCTRPPLARIQGGAVLAARLSALGRGTRGSPDRSPPGSRGRASWALPDRSKPVARTRPRNTPLAGAMLHYDKGPSHGAGHRRRDAHALRLGRRAPRGILWFPPAGGGGPKPHKGWVHPHRLPAARLEARSEVRAPGAECTQRPDRPGVDARACHQRQVRGRGDGSGMAVRLANSSAPAGSARTSRSRRPTWAAGRSGRYCSTTRPCSSA